MGIRDRPTSFRSPWQNGYVERLIGSIRRECTDHLIVFNAEHLRRILAKYTSYYNECELTFRWRRTRPADARSSDSETLSRIRSLAGCTIDTPESSFRKRQRISRCLGQDHGHDCKSRIAGLADQGKVAIAGCCRARATRSARSQPWLRRWPAPATSAIVNPPPDCTDQRMTSDPSSAIQNRYPPRGASPCAHSLQKRRSSRSPCYMALLRPRAMTHGGPLAGVRADIQFESVLVKGHDFDPVRALAGRVTSDRL